MRGPSLLPWPVESLSACRKITSSVGPTRNINSHHFQARKPHKQFIIQRLYKKNHQYSLNPSHLAIRKKPMEIKKTVWNLVVDLLSFSNQELKIYTSVDGGKTCKEMELVIDKTIINGSFTVIGLIHHLRLNFSDPNTEVKILTKANTYSIHIVGRKDGNCVFINYPKNN